MVMKVYTISIPSRLVPSPRRPRKRMVDTTQMKKELGKIKMVTSITIDSSYTHRTDRARYLFYSGVCTKSFATTPALAPIHPSSSSSHDYSPRQPNRTSP
jgi:hypothetical protein